MSPTLHFQVDGFRSLRGADFRIVEGLNVFVGPNGSGKTNVIALTDFLSVFLAKGVHAAIGTMGGATRVFSNELLSSGQKKAELTVAISGQLERDLDFVKMLYDQGADVDAESKTVSFSYNLTLTLDLSKFEVAITREELEWSIPGSSHPSNAGFLRASAIESAQNQTNIEGDLKTAAYKFLAPSFAERMILNKPADSVSFSSMIYKDAIRGKSLFSLVNILGIPDPYIVKSALSFERSFNISPKNVRSEPDIASADDISSDGTGVINYLYDMKSSSKSKRRTSKSTKRANSKYDKILTAFFEINEEINSLDITPNLRTGRLEGIFVVGDTNTKLPITSMSDGTAKWLAMLTIVKSGKYSSYCIEEPENYLHPLAQRIFINTLRGTAGSEPNTFFIVSTHSETIVNCIDPSEILICDYSGGSTRVRRVANADGVRKAIEDTGFGLGFLYANERL